MPDVSPNHVSTHLINPHHTPNNLINKYNLHFDSEKAEVKRSPTSIDVHAANFGKAEIRSSFSQLIFTVPHRFCVKA